MQGLKLFSFNNLTKLESHIYPLSTSCFCANKSRGSAGPLQKWMKKTRANRWEEKQQKIKEWTAEGQEEKPWDPRDHWVTIAPPVTVDPSECRVLPEWLGEEP